MTTQLWLIFEPPCISTNPKRHMSMPHVKK